MVKSKPIIMKVTLDDILKDIGEFGTYQKWIYSLLCFPAFVVGAIMTSNVFILGVPEHRCKIPGLENDTFEIQGPSHEYLINASIPLDDSGKRLYDRCHVYVVSNDRPYTGNTSFRQQQTCEEWVYDTSVFKFTFAQQLNMVCEDTIMIPNAQMVFFFGVLLGSIIYGQLSDIFGRRKTMYLCLLILIGSSIGLLAMVEYIGFCLLMFITGGTTLGLFVTAYVIGMELVGPSKRLWTGNIIHICTSAGVMYLILVVYLLRDWTYFTLAVGLPLCLCLPYYWIIPESSRWLLSNNRKQEAAVILEKIAHGNETTFDEKRIDDLHEPPRTDGRVWHLFTSKILAARTLIILFNWFVCSMSYYGVVFNIGNLGGDFYFNFTLMTLVEFPVGILGIPLMAKLGRKRLQMSYLIIGGTACIGTIWPVLDGRDSLHPVLIAFSLIGKMCITGAFITVYLHSSELFPTVVRNAGMGISSATARVGSMLAPYIAKSADLIGGNNGQAIPQTFFGVALFVAGLLTFFLPETMNRKLPESIEDANCFNMSVSTNEIVIDNEKTKQPVEVTLAS